MKIHILLGTALVAIAPASVLHADVVSDFQGYAEGQALDEGPATWVLNTNTGLSNNPDPFASDINNDGNLVGVFADRSSSQGHFVQNGATTIAEGQSVTLSFDFLLNDPDGSSVANTRVTTGIGLEEGSLINASDIAAGIEIDNGNLFILRGAGRVDTGLDYAANTGYSVVFQIDQSTDLYDAFITGGTFNNQQIADDAPFQNSYDDATGGFDLFIVRSNNNNATAGTSFTIDNIVTVVPEPGSMALLTLGGLTLLRRRRA